MNVFVYWIRIRWRCIEHFLYRIMLHFIYSQVSYVWKQITANVFKFKILYCYWICENYLPKIIYKHIIWNPQFKWDNLGSGGNDIVFLHWIFWQMVTYNEKGNLDREGWQQLLYNFYYSMYPVTSGHELLWLSRNSYPL